MSPAAAQQKRKTAVITGASQGIGAGLTSAMRQAGYAVVATSRSIPYSDESDLLTVQGDIAEVETAQRVVEQALDRFGRIDSLINNAGIFIAKPFTEYTPDDYAAITAVNLAGFLHITQRAIRQTVTQGSGHIVNITTSLVDHADSNRPSALVALTKGGLAAVTRSLIEETPTSQDDSARRVGCRAGSAVCTSKARSGSRHVWVTLWSPRGRSGSIPRRVDSENASCWPRTTAAMLASGSGM